MEEKKQEISKMEVEEKIEVKKEVREGKAERKSTVRSVPDRTFLTLPPPSKDILVSTGQEDQGHYAPAPSCPMDVDLTKNPENYQKINEWVLNHLPLKEEQKKSIIGELLTEARRGEISKNILIFRTELVKKEKEKKKKKKKTSRKGVKDHNSKPHVEV